MDSLDKRSMDRVNKQWQCSHHVACADLEKSGLLSQVSYECPVVGASVASP